MEILLHSESLGLFDRGHIGGKGFYLITRCVEWACLEYNLSSRKRGISYHRHGKFFLIILKRLRYREREVCHIPSRMSISWACEPPQ